MSGLSAKHLSSELDLTDAELDCLKSMAKSPWYSLRAEDPFEKETKNRVRASTVLIRANGIVRIRSKDIQLPGKHEAFRVTVDCESASGAVSSKSMEVCAGEGAWLADLELLPRPVRVSLVWNSYDYDVREGGASSTYTITVPDSLVIEGKKGKVLVAQHQLPTWLAVSADSEEVEAVLTGAARIDRIL